MTTTVYTELSGVTVAFGTHNQLTSTVLSLKLPGIETKEIDNTTLADVIEKSVASKLRKVGDLTIDVEFEPSKDYDGAVGSADEAITVTLPKLNSGSATAAKFVYFGHLSKVGDVPCQHGTKPARSLTIKVNGFGATGTDTTPFTAEA